MKYIFYGRVLPERIPITITLPEMKFTISEFGIVFRYSVSIIEGQFTIPVILEKGTTDLYTLKNLISEPLSRVVNLIGYLDGSAYTTDVISVVEVETAKTHTFNTNIPVLKESRQPVSHLDVKRFNAIVLETSSSIILADFRSAIITPVATGFYCYRSIEAIMHSMQPNYEEIDSVGWERLRTTLHISKTTIISIKNHAEYPRHGKIYALTDTQRKEIFQITDEIIRRYFEYLASDKTKLPEKNFPLLTIEVVS